MVDHRHRRTCRDLLGSGRTRRTFREIRCGPRGEGIVRIHQKQLRRGIVVTMAAGLAVPLMWALTPLTASAAVNCVVGPGVTQTATVVTGSPGNDTIDCGGTNPA